MRVARPDWTMGNRHLPAAATHPTRTALRAAVLFACVATAWLLFSGRLVDHLAPGPQHPVAQTAKALAFLLLATGALYLVVRRAVRHVAAAARGLAEAQALAHLGSFSHDVRTGRTVWSDELYRILGAEPDAVTPSLEALMGFVHPDDRHLLPSPAGLRDDGPLAHGVEHRVVRPDGTVRWLRTRARVELDAAGRMVRVAGTARDVTDRRAQERALRDQADLLRAFATRELAIRDEERVALARTVHDVLGQHAVVLRMMLAQMRRQATANTPLAELIAEAERTAAELGNAVRGLSGALRPPVMDGEGLAEALRRLARRFTGHGGPVIDVQAPDVDVDLAVATQLHRIAQEAILNAVRHAGAQKVSITLVRTPEQLRLSIADDGGGLAKDAPRGVGTTSMAERARLAGGTLEVRDPGALGGVEVVIEVRLAEAAP